jgi:hypothetical protein
LVTCIGRTPAPPDSQEKECTEDIKVTEDTQAEKSIKKEVFTGQAKGYTTGVIRTVYPL